MPENPANSAITCQPGETGQRLDQFLAKHFPEYPRTFHQKCIDQGCIQVNGKTIDVKSYKLQAGDELVADFPAPESHELRPEDIPLNIIFEDEHLLVINKPAGLAVHPGNGQSQGTLVNALLHYEPEVFTALLDEEQRPGIVHRLDQDTSGILVVAKTQNVQNKLKEVFQNHQIRKIYLALVRNSFDALAGTIEQPIARHPILRRQMAVSPQGKPALTRYRVLKNIPQAALLAVRIFTGRTHQIRVHCQFMGHPILGDQVYGLNTCQGLTVKPERQMLHAWKLAFTHPVTGDDMSFAAEPPEDFCQTASELFGSFESDKLAAMVQGL